MMRRDLRRLGHIVVHRGGLVGLASRGGRLGLLAFWLGSLCSRRLVGGAVIGFLCIRDSAGIFYQHHVQQPPALQQANMSVDLQLQPYSSRSVRFEDDAPFRHLVREGCFLDGRSDELGLQQSDLATTRRLEGGAPSYISLRGA